MKKLLIPQDKANHFIYGFLIFIGLNIFVNENIAFSTVCIIALLKEIVHDKILKKGTPEIKDFIFTILPAIILILKNYINV